MTRWTDWSRWLGRSVPVRVDTSPRSWSDVGIRWPAFPSDAMLPVRVVETEHEITVRAEVPGIAAEDLQVTLTGNVLSIRGRGRHPNGTRARAIALPSGVDASQVTATLKREVLTVTLRKFARSGPRPTPLQPA